MNIPHAGTISESVCQALLRNASKTQTEISQILNNTSRAGIERNLKLLVDAGLVLKTGRRLSLCDELRKHYENYKPPVPTSSVATSFKPWSGKHSPANYPRREELREVSIKTGSIGFFPSYRD